MANANSFADVINRQNAGQPLVISATTTLHQSFLIGGAVALLTIPNPMVSIDGGEFFPNFSPDGRPFILRAGGKVLGGEPYQIDIVQGTGLVNVIATTGLSTNGLAADNFLLEFEGMWDSQSSSIRGFYYGWAGKNSVNQASVVTALTGITVVTSLQFNVALTIASANANAVVTLTEFSGEFC